MTFYGKIVIIVCIKKEWCGLAGYCFAHWVQYYYIHKFSISIWKFCRFFKTFFLFGEIDTKLINLLCVDRGTKFMF